MLKFPEAYSGQDIALILPTNLVTNKEFIKREIISSFAKDIPDFQSRLTAISAFQGANGKKPTASQTKEHLEELYEYLETYGYKYAIVMDANYFKGITGNAFEASIGSVATAKRESLQELKVVPFVNPIVVKQRASKLPLYKLALQTAREMLLGTYVQLEEFKFTTYKMITDIQEMRETLGYLKGFKKLGYDIETTGLHHIKNEIITYALACSQEEAYTFVVHPKYIGEANSKEAHKLFREFLLDYQGSLVIHNVSFESKWLLEKYVMSSYDDYRSMNSFLKDWKFDDTMLMAYALYNSTEKVSLGLKDLVKRRYGDYDADINVKDALNQPVEALAYYNALDVSATLWLYDDLLKQLAPSQLHFYETEMKNAQVALTKLMATGIMVNMPNVLEGEEKLTARLAELNEVFYKNHYILRATKFIIQDMVDKYNSTHVKQVTSEFYKDIQFNPNSNKQLQLLLFEVMGYTPIEFTDSGAPKTSRGVLEELLETTRDPSAKEVLECLIGFSEVAIILNTFIRALKEDSIEVAPGIYRLYQNYRVGGTQTFRPTSSNPNLLNVRAS